MKLFQVKAGERFSYDGQKFMVIVKLKHQPKEYRIPCALWPFCGLKMDIRSRVDVKRIERV
ncbi:MAG: hypothetical protein COB36_12030 [Alphaproteobacteria bacterium]|nr:MAG: hypothetical protein COB36_12030 [Alphaproteobacteria bacterium]